MSDDISISAQRRTKTGTSECRRLRRQGRIPANVFGHKQEPLPVSIDRDAFRPVLTTGHKVIDLTIDGHLEKALVREVQWDTFSTEVQHIDFQRIDVTERMRVDVPVVLRGTPQGVIDGGILDHQLHTLTVNATAAHLPDHIEIRVNDLGIGQSIHVADITNLPPEVTIETPGEFIVVQVSAAVEMPEVERVEEELATQPELVGRKKEAEESKGED
jgi:large subunit ribosomal protein L25